MPEGSAVQDDATILPTERLLRRVHPAQIVFDQNQGCYRPSSAAFEDLVDGVSVFLRSVLDEIPAAEEDVLSGFDKHSLVVVTAAEVRALDEDLGVVRDPNSPDGPHPCAPAHALIVGVPRGKAGLKKFRKPVAKKAQWVVLRTPSAA